MDVKTIVQEFEDKVKALKKDTDNLGKKKANYESDIASLSKRHQELNAAIAQKGKYLADEVTKAVSGAMDRLERLRNEVEQQKETLAKERGQAGTLKKNLEDRIEENVKLRKNLENSIKEYADLQEEIQEIKNKLEKTIETIKGVL